MFKKIMAFFGISLEGGEVIGGTRRKYVRHPAFNAEVIIGDKVYVAHDWSMGGIAFETGSDSTSIKEGERVMVILKFHFPNNTITIGQKAHVIRSLYGTTAVEFDPLPNSTRNDFNKVLESLYTQSFIESQSVG